jgi:hypothetical protein
MTSMPQPSRPGETDSAGEVILGVDTHADVHVAALLSAVGGLVATASFAATAAGYRALLTWARGHGPVRTAGVEGTGSYGVALARHLRRAGVPVIEVNRPDRAARRRRGKTDTVDAEAAARAVLDGRATVTPKTADGPVETLRLLKLAKDSAVKARTQAINQLKAVLVGADPTLRESLAGLGRACGCQKPCEQLRDLRVFVDQAAEPVVLQDAEVGVRGVLRERSHWCCLAQCPVRTVGVEVVLVLLQDSPGMHCVDDQKSVQQLAADTADEPLRDRVRPRGPAPGS